jgi:aspartokinase/homoserine dehydrogenase 1
LKILKFGGTSVGTPEAIAATVAIIAHAKSQGSVMAVCSAMGGVTNSLLELGEQARHGEEFIDVLREIEQRHYAVIRQLLKPEQQNKALIAVKVRINALEEILFGVKALEELSLATRDKIASFGELLSNEMIAEILTHGGHRAVFTDARQYIRTDSNFGNATVDKALSYDQLQAWAASLGDVVPLFTGFIGANAQGQTTTLGRGGSDYSAALLGAALQAEEIQIWTDVDGFLTADPRRVRKAYPLETISYEEAMELCYFGAKVIYPPTMLPAIEKQIPLVVKNTFNPEGKGTTVKAGSDEGQGLIKGIASIDAVCLINLQGSGLIGSKGLISRLFSTMADAGVNIMLITQASSEHSISIAIAPGEVDAARNAIESTFELELLRGKIEKPQVVTGLSIVAVVGDNMRHTVGISGKLFQTLGRNGVNVVAIAQGSSERNISVVIEQKALSKALNAVHDALFLSSLKTVNAYLVGTGNIGATLINQLRDSAADLAERHHMQIRVMGITNSRKMLLSTDGEGLDLIDWKALIDKSGKPANIDQFIAEAGAQNLANAVFVDNTSNPGIVAKYPDAFGTGLSIATCNKIGNASSLEQYLHFRKLARRNGVQYHYETTVGAALPIIQTLNDLMMSGDHVVRLEAILSGTISFIFNNYHGDATFAEVVREAQRLGYTEPDPRDDLNGMDFSRKLLILAREMGLPMEMESVKILPILPESCLSAPDIDSFYSALEKAEDHFAAMKNEAAAQGKRLRYIGILEQGEIRVAPESVDSSHPFFGLEGSDNIIAFSTARYNQGPLVVKGPGAGPQVTAAGVYADIIKVASA